MRYYSQLGQDAVVDKLLKGKLNGTFVDLGASYFDDMNNTYYFEKEKSWRGIAVEIESIYNDGWKNRPNTVYFNEDALAIDYNKILSENSMPKIIDYLSIDLEPPEITYQAFCKIMQTDYIFNVVTFEVDYYRNTVTRDPSRQMMKDKGYILIGEILDRGYHIDDVYVHNSIYDENIKL